MCCPLYIIRCDAPNFTMKKSQKKVLNKLKLYLLTGRGEPSKHKKEVEMESESVSNQVSTSLEEDPSKKIPKVVKKGVGPDPAKPLCRKAKEIRREKKMLKESVGMGVMETGQSGLESNTGTGPKSSTRTGQTSSESNIGTGQISSIPGGISSIAGPTLAVPSAVPPYMQVHENGRKPLEDFLQFPTPEQNPAHILEIRLVRSHPPSPEFLASLRDSYNLHKKYQINIHKDLPSKCTMQSFTRFLVDSPLIPEPGPPEWKIGYGSYHQQYYLDGRLIMVGVIDILPNCLSSKYLYYDTDFEFLTLGVVSALNEIALTRKLHVHNPEFQYYCMGYYVHSCQKMKYKGEYTPSFLLCPETYNYVPIEQCRPKLDIQKYSRFSGESEVVDSDKNPVESYLDSTLVLHKHEAMQYESFCALFGKQDDKVKEYARLVGPMVAKQCLLFIS